MTGVANPSGWGLSKGLITLSCKITYIYDLNTQVSGYIKWKKDWKLEIGLTLYSTWNVRSLQEQGAALNLVREAEKYTIKCIALRR